MSSSLLTLRDDIVDGSTVLMRAAGDLDSSTLAQLIRAVDAAFLAGSDSIVVDLTHAAAVCQPVLDEFAVGLPSVGPTPRRLAVAWPQAPVTGVLFSGRTAIVVAVRRTTDEGRRWVASPTPERVYAS